MHMTRNSHSIKIFYLILAVSVLPLSCDFLFPGREDVNPDIGGVDQELFPLAVGNYWDYRTFYFWADTLRLEILNEYELSFDGRVYKAFGYDRFPIIEGLIPSEREWLYAHSPRGLLAFGGKYRDEIALKNSLQFKYPGNSGDSWVLEVTAFDIETGKFTKDSEIVMYLLDTDAPCSSQTIEMDGCYVYHHEDISTTDALYHWYRYIYVKPGIGVISIETFDGPKGLVTNPPIREIWRQDLINYHIDGQ